MEFQWNFDGISMEFSWNIHVGTSLNLLLLLHLGQGPIAGLPLLQVVHLHLLFAGAIPIHLLVLEIGVVEEPESMYHSIIIVIVTKIIRILTRTKR